MQPSARGLAAILALALVACPRELQRPVAMPKAAGQGLQGMANVGTAVQLDGSDSIDPQAYSLTFKWRILESPTGSRATLNSETSEKPSFVADLPGKYVVELVVSNSVLSDAATVEIDVSPCGGYPPVLGIVTSGILIISAPPGGPASPTPQAAAAGAEAKPGDTVQVSVPVTDADSACNFPETLEYAWTLKARPAGSSAVIPKPRGAVESGVAATAFVPDVPGSYQFEVVVADSTGLSSAPATGTIEVSTCGENAPVVGSISPTSGVMGTPIILGDSASDQNCLNRAPKTFTHNWTLVIPAGSQAFLNNPASATPQFTPDVAGTYQVSEVVTNPQGFSSPVGYQNITVSKCSTSPLVWSGTPVTSSVMLDPDNVTSAIHVGARVMLTPHAAEPTGNTCGSVSLGTIQYSWTMVSRPTGSQAALSSATDATPFFMPDVPGSYVFSTAGQDALGNATSAPATASTTVTTSNCGAYPL